MAIDDLPAPVVTFLNVIGVQWPYIYERSVLQFASLARDFGQAVQTTQTQFAKVAQAMAGLDWSKTTPAGSESTGFALDDQAVRAGTGALRQHAQAFRSHALTFQQGIQELSF